MASLVPSSVPGSSGSSPRALASGHVLAVDESGHGEIVRKSVSRSGWAELASNPLKQVESAPNAPTSPSLSPGAALLSEAQLDEMNVKHESEDLRRVVQHAFALESLRQVERAEHLNQLDRAKRKITQLEAALDTLSDFSAPSSHLEVARLQSENDQLARQSIALARKLQHASSELVEQARPSPLTEEELRIENRRLLADVGYLERRLLSKEKEAARLTSELRRLRSYYLQGVPLVVHDAEITLPPSQAVKAGSRAVLLGDAEAELLLQAGKTCSHVRRIQRIPLDKAIQDQAEEIVQAIVPRPVDPIGPSSHSHLTSKRPVTLSEPSVLAPISTDSLAQGSTSFQLPVPFSLRDHAALAAANADASATDFGPQNPNANLPKSPSPFLETDAVGLPIPPPVFATARSAELPSTQRDTDSSGASSGPHHDISQYSFGDDGANATTEEALPIPTLPAVFGLPMVGSVDELPIPPPIHRKSAAASRSRGPVPFSARNIGGTISNGPGDSGNAGTIGKPIGRTPSALDLLSEAAGAMHSGTNGEPYNPRSRKPKLDANGEKKARSPYIKWNVEEDEQLLNAVIACGCAWDSVAKLCPTRAYHQVRQRFLRGLRSGDTLPPELAHMQPAVKKAVADYEARKKSKKKQPRRRSVGSHENDELNLAQYDDSQANHDEVMDAEDYDEMDMEEG